MAAAMAPVPARASPLSDLVRRGQPVGAVRILAEAQPELLEQREEEGGDLPLHVAIREKAPTEVVRFLALACDRALREKGKDGLLPLQLAVREGSPLDAIECLHAASPDGIRENVTYPLEDEGVVESPLLHFAVLSGRSLDMVESLYRMFPDAIHKKASSLNEDVASSVPLLHFASERSCSLDVLAFILDKFPAAIEEKASCQLGSGDVFEFPLLHYVIREEGKRSSDVFEFICRMLPEAVHQKTLWKSDWAAWKLPLLHWAVARDNSLPAIQYLYEKFPEAIQQKAENGSVGLLPLLHWAVEVNTSLDVLAFLFDKRQDAIHETAFFQGENSFIEWPLLHYAIMARKPLEMVSFLYDRMGVAANQLKATGQTFALVQSIPLLHMTAGCHDSLEVLQFIYDKLPEAVHEKASWSGYGGPELTLLHVAAGRDSAIPLDMLAFICQKLPDALWTLSARGKLPVDLARDEAVGDVASWLERAMKEGRHPSSPIACIVCHEIGASHACFPCRHLFGCQPCIRLIEIEARRRGQPVRCACCNLEATSCEEIYLPSLSPSGIGCVVCQEPGADHAFFPCRHLCVCESCAEHPRMDDAICEYGAPGMRCPHCNEAAESCKKMFF
jgi:ankyrin repeat protein